jgi:hypothetical protein
LFVFLATFFLLFLLLDLLFLLLLFLLLLLLIIFVIIQIYNNFFKNVFHALWVFLVFLHNLLDLRWAEWLHVLYCLANILIDGCKNGSGCLFWVSDFQEGMRVFIFGLASFAIIIILANRAFVSDAYNWKFITSITAYIRMFHLLLLNFDWLKDLRFLF